MKIDLDHIVLNVKDIKASIEFYTKIIGLESERYKEYLDGKAPFPSLRVNQATVIDLFPPERWLKNNSLSERFTNLNHYCLSLEHEQWLKLSERLKENNVLIHRGPTDNWGAKGIGISIFIYDIDGNEIEFRYYPNSD